MKEPEDQNGKAEPTTEDVIHLIPQEHGGALQSQGTPGNRGGGRPTNDLRKASSESYVELKERLEKMSKAVEGMFDEETKKKNPNITIMLQSINALRGVMDVMGRYGPGVKVEHLVEKVEWIELTYDMVLEAFPGQAEGHAKFADLLCVMLKN